MIAAHHRRRAPGRGPARALRRLRPVAAANLATALLWASFLAQIYEATLFTQEALHWTPLAAGASGLTIAFVSLAQRRGSEPDRLAAGGEMEPV